MVVLLVMVEVVSEGIILVVSLQDRPQQLTQAVEAAVAVLVEGVKGMVEPVALAQ